MDDTQSLWTLLRQASDPDAVDAIAELVRDGPDDALTRINALHFADSRGLPLDPVISAFLHATRLGLFELAWNVLCPGCGGVLQASDSLKAVRNDEYSCALCAAGYEPTLDEMVEVTFTVSPRARRIAAHHPESLPLFEYCRQVFWSSGVDLPDDAERIVGEVVLDAVELGIGEKAIISVQLPAGFLILFDPVNHNAHFLEVAGAPTSERQHLSIVLTRNQKPTGATQLRPGPLRLALENRSDGRALPGLWIAGDTLHDLLGRRRPFLTAKRLLTNQSFRELFGANVLDVDQWLKITSLTFMFTDIKGSTILYEKVGDLAAYDLVRAHFRLLQEIVAEEGGAVVKTIGDAVMAAFPTPECGLAAALRIRDAVRGLGQLGQEILLKIGLHEGPCLAVTLNDRQDYFGQTVNIAARVQGLATSRAIFASRPVVECRAAEPVLARAAVPPVLQDRVLPGLAGTFAVYEIP